MAVPRPPGDGDIFAALDAEAEPILFEPYPYLMRKLLLFGGINDGPRQSNRH